MHGRSKRLQEFIETVYVNSLDPSRAALSKQSWSLPLRGAGAGGGGKGGNYPPPHNILSQCDGYACGPPP